MAYKNFIKSVDLLKSKILSFISKLKKKLAGIFLFLNKFISKFKGSKTDLVSEDIDKKLVYSLSRTKIPTWSQLKHIGRVLNRGEIWSLRVFFTLFFASAGFLGFTFVRANLVVTPAFGGEYTEAVVGSPQHINPLYSVANDADADLVRLIFSSLFYLNDNGEPVGDLVDSYEISADGKLYTLKLKDEVRWHGGENLTSDDVVFTFNAIKNPAYNSPLRQSFNGIEIEAKDDLSVSFILPERYSPFLNLLTFGILPAQKWQNISPQSAALAEFNIKPEGSGPYKYLSFVKGKDGSIRSYRLTANRDYYSGRPNIKTITFKFYNDIKQALGALNSGEVIGLNYLSSQEKSNLIAKNSVNVNKLGLPQMKVVFFNTGNNPVLKDAKVRQALSCAIPRADIITEVLNGDGKAIYGPILPNSFAYNENFDKCDFDIERAQNILKEDAWEKFTINQEAIDSLQRKASSSQSLLSAEDKSILALGVGEWLSKNEILDKAKKTTQRIFLTVKFSYLDDDESLQIANKISEQWRRIGINVVEEAVSSVQMQSSVIKPRAYEVLLFGEQVGSDPDIYAFWHSSQAGKNGLNLSNYSNEEADKFLEQGRTASTNEERIKNYTSFQESVARDVPASFLYSPYYLYVQNKKIKNFSLKNIFTPADRFNGVVHWYIKSGWKIK